MEILHGYATVSRCGFNFVLRMKIAVYDQWRRGRDDLVAAGMDKEEANKSEPKARVPNRNRTQACWRETEGQGFIGPLRHSRQPNLNYDWQLVDQAARPCDLSPATRVQLPSAGAALEEGPGPGSPRTDCLSVRPWPAKRE
ncbi:hypothetical protein [Streptomyces violascens]|uniref:hypothetical protein n=1 Tax=Streptomyces violascens TaxID=67381 RepID=UPI00167A8500|nr:hypothetical protein [Streptomyces violascens]